VNDRVRALVAKIEAGTLPQAEWTHEAHVTFATWAVLAFGRDAALGRIRSAILRLNAAHGVANTPSAGYHESITRFYVARVGTLLEESGAEAALSSAISECVATLDDRALPIAHWSRDRLFSPEARGWWVEPDLLPLSAAVAVE
jgi:hypothetical protein